VFRALTLLSSPQIREGQLAQYNFILVVGDAEIAAGAVNIRTRENEVRRCD
jgi:threonyl-tRNA synthetase